MEKHGRSTPYSLIETKPGVRCTNTRTERIVDTSCIAGLWICGGALSTVQLGLQPDESQNIILRRWQNVSAVHWAEQQYSLRRIDHAGSGKEFAGCGIAWWHRALHVRILDVVHARQQQSSESLYDNSRDMHRSRTYRKSVERVKRESARETDDSIAHCSQCGSDLGIVHLKAWSQSYCCRHRLTDEIGC